jgi:nicotinate phosphoribosyltransferase
VSITDGKRLPPEVFRIDAERMRRGWYTDAYFSNAALILRTLAEKGYRFEGQYPVLQTPDVNPHAVDVGNIVVEMQCFTKRKPFSIAAGTDEAIAILKECCGYFDSDGVFVSTYDQLEVCAVQDGTKLLPWVPAMRVRGRYRDFAILETTVLGALARRTRIATSVYRALVAARGKPIFFFPARFDIYQTQPGDGYAYRVGVEAYNMGSGKNVAPLISTHAQGEWWGQKGVGTVSHSYILCFLRDTAEAMIHFAEILPPEVKRIALVDTNNDCVTDSIRTAVRMFEKYRECIETGREDEAQKYVLFGVRPDTAEDIVDASVERVGNDSLECGVTPSLVRNLRTALDECHKRVNLPEKWRARAQEYFQNVRIVATGGFDPDRVRMFEAVKAPVDMYGIGSFFMEAESNDFTADVVRVKLNDQWLEMAKVGRKAVDNPDIERV